MQYLLMQFGFINPILRILTQEQFYSTIRLDQRLAKVQTTLTRMDICNLNIKPKLLPNNIAK